MGAEFSFLLGTLLLLLLAAPFFQEHHLGNLIFDGLLTLVLLSGVATVSERRFPMAIGLTLALPVIAARWLAYFAPNRLIVQIGMVCALVYLAYVAVIILTHIMRQRDISRDLVVGSLCVYLLLGLSWAFAFGLLEDLRPGSFHWPAAERVHPFFDMIYYSLVTLTTVGYGDITPLSAVARSLSMVEAVIGQFYLTVLVARLVGLRITQQAR
jgi:hypothetical protein